MSTSRNKPLGELKKDFPVLWSLLLGQFLLWLKQNFFRLVDFLPWPNLLKRENLSLGRRFF